MTSWWSRMKPISTSSETYSVRWRAVSCGSARKTGADLVDPLEHADHDLLVELRTLRQVRAGDRSSRSGRRWRRSRSPTATIFGVWISVNPRRVERAAKARHATPRPAADGARGAGGAAPRRRGRASSGAVREVLGRRSSNGGADTGSATTVDLGSYNLDPRRRLRRWRPPCRRSRSPSRRAAQPAARRCRSSTNTTWAMPLRSRSKHEGDLRELSLMMQPSREAHTSRRPRRRGQLPASVPSLTSIRPIPDVRARGRLAVPPHFAAAGRWPRSIRRSEGVTPHRHCRPQRRDGQRIVAPGYVRHVVTNCFISMTAARHPAMWPTLVGSRLTNRGAATCSTRSWWGRTGRRQRKRPYEWRRSFRRSATPSSTSCPHTAQCRCGSCNRGRRCPRSSSRTSTIDPMSTPPLPRREGG